MMLHVTDVKYVRDYVIWVKFNDGINGGSYGHFFDAEDGIKMIPFKNFSIFGGYRIIDLKVEHDSNFVNLQLTGHFFGGTLRF